MEKYVEGKLSKVTISLSTKHHLLKSTNINNDIGNRIYRSLVDRFVVYSNVCLLRKYHQALKWK